MVPQLQFNGILVGFSVVAMKQIPMVLGDSSVALLLVVDVPVVRLQRVPQVLRRRCAHAATSSSCMVGQLRVSDSEPIWAG